MNWPLLKKFMSYYRPHKWLFMADMSAALMVAVCNMFYPMITRNVINSYVPGRNMRLILTWAFVLLLVYALKAALSYFIQYYGHMMGVRMQVDMRRDAFNHLQGLPFSYYDRTQTGNIMSRIINDTMDITELAHHGPEDLFTSLVMLVGAFFLLGSMDWYLTLIIFAFIPLLVWFLNVKRLKLAKTSMKTRERIGQVNADLQNSIAGVRVSKAFETSEHELEKLQSGNMSYQKARSKQYQAMAEFHSGTGFIMDVLALVTLLAGAVFTFYGRITIGDYTAYLLFVRLFTEPIRKLINFTEQLQTGMTGFTRLQELMAEPVEEDAPGAKVLEDVKGDISFEDVSFHYDDKQRVLTNINLHIEPGETVAVVGPSGSGKSTLCHLLPRFYVIDSGSLKVDGTDVRDYTLSSLRGNIGIVQQDTFLFSGNIRDNIAYGDVDATDEEIWEAVRNASLEEFVNSLPAGLDTYVGERGVTLSGGQKQRIAIARVFLRNPRILILDEATSALDNTTEIAIQSALERLSEGRTTMVVAHRLSTVRHADKIVVLTSNGIEEEGTHEELLAKRGLYTRLWLAQERTDTERQQEE